MCDVNEEKFHNWLRKLSSSDVSTRNDAVRVLGGMGDKRAVEPLIRMLGDGKDRVRQSAVEALIRLEQPQWAEWVQGDCDDFDRLSRCGDNRVLPAFIWALGDLRVGRGAAAHLVAMGKLAVAPLIKALKDESAETRDNAAWALGEIGDSRARKPLVEALGDKESFVGRTVASAAAKMGAAAFAPLIKTLNSGEWRVVEDAVHGLAELGDRRAIEPLIPVLKHQNSYVRCAVAFALGQLKDARAVAALRAAVGDKDRNVVHEIEKALQKLEEANDETISESQVPDAASKNANTNRLGDHLYDEKKLTHGWKSAVLFSCPLVVFLILTVAIITLTDCRAKRRAEQTRAVSPQDTPAEEGAYQNNDLDSIGSMETITDAGAKRILIGKSLQKPITRVSSPVAGKWKMGNVFKNGKPLFASDSPEVTTLEFFPDGKFEMKSHSQEQAVCLNDEYELSGDTVNCDCLKKLVKFKDATPVLDGDSLVLTWSVKFDSTEESCAKNCQAASLAISVAKMRALMPDWMADGEEDEPLFDNSTVCPAGGTYSATDDAEGNTVILCSKHGRWLNPGFVGGEELPGVMQQMRMTLFRMK